MYSYYMQMSWVGKEKSWSMFESKQVKWKCSVFCRIWELLKHQLAIGQRPAFHPTGLIS
jgi:hypothetical protein